MFTRSLPAAENIDRVGSDAVALEGMLMVRRFLTLSLAICVALVLRMGPVAAQQAGGILKFFHRDSPASMSIHEEATISTVAPMMGVFNNLVLFKQDEQQNRPEFIQPELAESWSWDEDHTRLTFKLRQGVKWHDGKPFTAADVKCTWDMLTGKSQEKLRLNPRKAWYRNLKDVVLEGESLALSRRSLQCAVGNARDPNRMASAFFHIAKGEPNWWLDASHWCGRSGRFSGH